jgi:hypothetical protein
MGETARRVKAEGVTVEIWTSIRESPFSSVCTRKRGWGIEEKVA